MILSLIFSCTMIDNVRPERQRTLKLSPLDAQHAYVLPSHGILWLEDDISELNDDEISSLCNRSQTDSKLKALLNKDKIVYGVMEITPSAIIFNDKSVVLINNGQIKDDQVDGLLIEPLLNLLEKYHDLNNRLNRYCNTGNQLEKVVYNIHGSIPFDILRAVLYTSGQAGFETFALTRSESTKPCDQAQPTNTSRRIKISVTNEDSYTIEVGRETTDRINVEKNSLSEKFDELEASMGPIGCAVIEQPPEITWKISHNLVDEIQGLGLGTIYFGGTQIQKEYKKEREKENTFTTNSVPERPPYTINLTTDLKVLRISLPKVGMHNEVDELSECYFGVKPLQEAKKDRLETAWDLDKTFQ